MSFLRSHGIVAAIGHALGAGLHIVGASPEMYLSEHLNEWLAAAMPAVGYPSWPPESWPAYMEPRWMLYLTGATFLLLTMPGSIEPDPLGDTGLDEQLQDAVTEVRLMRLGLVLSYSVGFMISEENPHGAYDWSPMLWLPVSVVAIPLAVAITYVVLSLSFAVLQLGMFRLCGLCGPSQTAADMWGPSIKRRSAMRLLRRNVMF